jgi:catechol 2,3-dioxygenase
MGHIHLHVADRMRAAGFYSDVIGFDITTRDYPGAIFLSANRYHHHVAVNEWAGEVAPPVGATGLIDFEVVVPDDGAVGGIAARAGVPAVDGMLRLRDPDGNGVVIRVD